MPPHLPPPQGMGDVLLTYENEAIFTNLVVPEKDRLPFIVPDNNIRVRRQRDRRQLAGLHSLPLSLIVPPSLPAPGAAAGRCRLPPPCSECVAVLPQIQCPLALVDANLADAPPETREAATAFCNYLYTKEAQREFAACGFR